MFSAARAVIFDLDGTLVDSLEDIADAANGALRALGFPTHPLEPYASFVGDGMGLLARRCAPPEAGEEGVARVLELIRKRYAETWHVKTRPYAGIPALIAALRERGMALAVLSNKPHQETLAVAAHFFPDHPFARVQGSPSPLTPAKPDPALALEVAAFLGASPERVLFLGDTRTDMETAVNAGMTPIGVLWGFRSRDELEKTGARAVLEKPGDLPAIVGRLPARAP